MNKTIIIKEDSTGAYYIDENNSRVEMGDSWDKVVDYLEIRAAVHESEKNPKPSKATEPLPWNWYQYPEYWPEYWSVDIPSNCDPFIIPAQVLRARGERPLFKDQARAETIMHDSLSKGWGNGSLGILFSTAYEWGRMNGKKGKHPKTSTRPT